MNNLLSRFDGHMQEVLRGAGLAFFLKIFAAAATFGLNVVIARMLGAEGSGVFFLAFTIVVVVATFGRVGMENVLVRFVSINVTADKPEKVMGIYKKAITYAAAVSFILSTLLYLFTPWLSIELFDKPNLEGPLQIMALGVFPLALLTLHAYALQGLRHTAGYISVLSLWVPLTTAVLSLLWIHDYGITGAGYSYLFATNLTLVIGWLLWRRASTAFRQNTPKFSTEELLNTSFPLYIANILSMILTWAPLLMLGIWESSANVGIYNAAIKTALLTSFILISVNSIAAPKFASLYQKNDMKALGDVSRGTTKLMIILASPILVVFILIPEWILLLFGEEFQQGSTVLMILAVGQFINVATGSVGYLLQMTGHERLVRNTLFFSTLLLVVLSIMVIPVYGMVGAAVVSAVMLAVQNIIMMLLVWKYLNIITFPWVNRPPEFNS